MESLKVKKIQLDDINEYMKEEKEIRLNMENPEWLGDFTKKDYIYLIENDIMNIYVFYYKNNVVGASSLIKISDEDKREYLSNELEATDIIDFGPVWVNPKYVGNGYQVKFIKYLEELIKDKYKYAVTTIDPQNIYSIKNFEKCCFECLGTVSLKRGKRLVYRKEVGGK